MVVVYAGALLVSWASTDPGRETFLRGKGSGGRADFRNDLLRGVHPQTGYLRQPLDCILMLAEQTGHLLVQFADLLVDQPTFLQRHLQQPPIDVVQLRTGAECVAQLFWRGTQALIGQSSQGCWVGFTFGKGL